MVGNIQIIFGNTVAAAWVLLRSTCGVCAIVIPNFDTIVPEANVFGGHMRHQVMIVDQPPVIRKHEIRKIGEPVCQCEKGGEERAANELQKMEHVEGGANCAFPSRGSPKVMTETSLKLSCSLRSMAASVAKTPPKLCPVTRTRFDPYFALI